MLIEKEISLNEALTGVDFVVTHLDGTKIRVQNKPGEVIKPDDLKTIPEKGLPFHKTSFKFGNLFVIFKVKFPDSLTLPQVANVKLALGHMKGLDADMADASETVKLIKFEESQRNTHAQGGTEGDSEEEDEGMGGGRGQKVQCAQ